MIKYLLLVAFVFGLVYWLSVAAARRRNGSRPGAQAQENMVSCAHCGVHLPQTDSVTADARFYCSEEHRLAGPQ